MRTPRNSRMLPVLQYSGCSFVLLDPTSVRSLNQRPDKANLEFRSRWRAVFRLVLARAGAIGVIQI